MDPQLRAAFLTYYEDPWGSGIRHLATANVRSSHYGPSGSVGNAQNARRVTTSVRTFPISRTSPISRHRYIPSRSRRLRSRRWRTYRDRRCPWRQVWPSVARDAVYAI